MRRQPVVLLLLWIGLVGWPVTGCSKPPGQKPDGGSPDGAGRLADDDPLPLFTTCCSVMVPSDRPTESWRHWTSWIIAAADAGHSAQDVVTNPKTATSIVGKLAYGTTSKDLEDEWVEVWLDRCGGEYTRLGRALTDSDGRIALPLPAEQVPGVGVYSAYLRVVGDNTATSSLLWVLPRGTKLAVFDIDATLTTDDLELFQDLMADVFKPVFDGDHVPEARAGAVEAVRIRHATQGYVIVYLTGRPYLLTHKSAEWLSALGFVRGVLHHTDDIDDIWPSEDAVGAYKAAYLNRLLLLGLDIHAAYGNATTDIYAYERVGLPKQRTYILGKHGGEAGTTALGEDYLEHLKALEREPPAEQPFRWR